MAGRGGIVDDVVVSKGLIFVSDIRELQHHQRRGKTLLKGSTQCPVGREVSRSDWWEQALCVPWVRARWFL